MARTKIIPPMLLAESLRGIETPHVYMDQNKRPKVSEALIKWDSQGPKALEQGSGRSPEGVNQYFLKLIHYTP
jgi:hypothetical protein